MCAPEMVFFNEKFFYKDWDNFWHTKLTLKVRILPFLTAFTQVTARLKNVLMGYLLVLGLKEGLSCHLLISSCQLSERTAPKGGPYLFPLLLVLISNSSFSVCKTTARSATVVWIKLGIRWHQSTDLATASHVTQASSTCPFELFFEILNCFFTFVN